jgi:hypothetical protein
MASERDRRRLIRPLGIVAVPVTSAECGQAGGCFRFPANRPPLANVLIVHWKKVAGRPESYTSSGPWQVPEIQYFVDALGRFTDAGTFC